MRKDKKNKQNQIPFDFDMKQQTIIISTTKDSIRQDIVTKDEGKVVYMQQRNNDIYKDILNRKIE